MPAAMEITSFLSSTTAAISDKDPFDHLRLHAQDDDISLTRGFNVALLY